LVSWRDLIRGEVAEIIDDRKVVLNIGMGAQVKKGMRFIIYAETEHVYDKSGKDLGILEIPKAEVEVVDVQEKLSIAENAAYVEVPLPPSYLSPWSHFPSFEGTRRSVRVPQELPIDKDKIKKIQVDLRIEKGDKVRQVP